MLHDDTMSIKPMELLEFFRGYRFLENFGLVLYCRRGDQVFPVGPASSVCGELESDLNCRDHCRSGLEKTVVTCLDRGKAVAFHCRAGLLNFAVPLLTEGLMSYCLIGGGLREKSVNLKRMESLAKSCSLDPFALLEKLDGLPVGTLTEVKEAAARVSRIIKSFNRENLHSRLLDRSIERLSAVTSVSVQVDRSTNVQEALDLVKEALAIIFDIPAVAVVVNDNCGEFTIQAALGMAKGAELRSGYHIASLFHDDCSCITLTGKDVASVFPGEECGTVLCLPMHSGETLLGMVALFDGQLHQRDVKLAELLIGRLAAKLMLAEKKEDQVFDGFMTGKLLSLINSISTSGDKEELYRTILESAADLVQATTGSLMLICDDGSTLGIKAAIGMSPRLAQSMKLEVGSGIAGKVAANGQPMLVDDIEEDKRVGIRNRHRFSTKSFISLPLKAWGKTVGVLNLSDRRDGSAFTKDDLTLLNSMVNQVAVVLERVESKEKAEMLEQISVTDPITGLFNERYLRLRLEEELSRAARGQDTLAVALIDLDDFSLYHRLYGAARGDELIRQSTSLLKTSLRQMDTLTRISEGMFCLLTPGTGMGESLIVAERIRTRIEGAFFPGEEHLRTGKITSSIGISIFPEHGENPETLLNAARIALERARSAGGNRVVHYSTGVTGGSKVVPINSASRQ